MEEVVSFPTFENMMPIAKINIAEEKVSVHSSARDKPSCSVHQGNFEIGQDQQPGIISQVKHGIC